MTTQPIHMYFNPNWNPSEYYPALKPLVAVYDQVRLWSPDAEDIEDQVGKVHSVFSARDDVDGYSLVVPAARDQWFAGLPSDAVGKRLRQLGREYGGVLDTADYAIGYAALDGAWSDDQTREPLVESASAAASAFDASQMRDIERVADREGRPIEWAIANAYIQDAIAMGRLGHPVPLTTTAVAQGYRVLAQVDDPGLAVTPGVGMEKGAPRLPDLPRGVTPSDVDELLRFLTQVDTLSWADVIDFRRRHGAALRNWLHDVRRADPRPLSAVSRETMDKLQGDIETAVKGLGATLGALAASPWGAYAVGGAAGGLLGLAAAKRYYTKLGPVAAKVLSVPPSSRFLVETAAWTKRIQQL